ncbi:hypothetical protein ACL02R_20535 [Streptomyces sp. MS19]|uniref:hypothetical protein n=1 Tax=Streptomyces sp. MS19 TaxID=3385972 RepID=UPI0039A3164C
MNVPYVSGDWHPACGICPARRYPFGGFDVAERPSREFPFSVEDGHRYTADGVPVCVHPDRVGVPAARYRTEGTPLSADLALPDDPDELADFLRDVLHGAAPGLLDVLIEKAASEMARRFPEVSVTETLRRALG